MRLHIQRVDDLNFDRTIARLIGGMIGNRVIGTTETVGFRSHRLAQDFVDSGLRELKFITSVANTNDTGDSRAVTIRGAKHGTIDGLVRYGRIDLDVLSTFEVRLLLTEQAEGLTRIL